MIISTNRKTRLKITADIDYSVTVSGINVGGSLVFSQGATLLTVTTAGTFAFTSDDSTKTLAITSAGLTVPVTVTLAALDNCDEGCTVSVVSAVLPTGAATAAAQVSAQTALDTIAAAIKSEDNSATHAGAGFYILGVRRDVAFVAASASGDYQELTFGKFGDLTTSKVGTQKRTYSAAFSIVPAASATDVVEIIGSASTTVEISRITIGGVQTTAGQVLVNLIRRSTANSSGSSTNPTRVPHQSTDAAATAAIKAYTANPTTGTLVGNVRSRRLPIGAAASFIPATVYEFGENAKPLFLAGTSQTLCINLAGATVAGAILDIEIEFTEV
jgi:hypothetical protein